jgi:alanine racemase
VRDDGPGEAVEDDAAAVLTIDLGAIVANYAALRERSGGAACAGTVKADAYGTGMARVAPALYAAGCRCFFVATLAEGIALAALLRGVEIYVLNGPTAANAAAFAAHGLRPVLNSLEQVAAWRAVAAGARPPAALHVDTGLARLGLSPQETARLCADPAQLESVEIALVMSHLACSEEAEHPMNPRQQSAFEGALTALRQVLPRPFRASLAASFGIYLGPQYHFDLTRAGAALYGVAPVAGRPNPMQPVVTLKARIIQVREIDAGATVGYGATHRLARPARLAVVGAGYADGYFRSLGNRGSAFIGEQRVPVVGRISMDLTTLDVSAVAPERSRPGDWVELIGSRHTVDDLAREAGTSGYEILTALGPRYRRLYVGG